ncbi:MAG: hypothetical protein IT304_08975 [Dehalococcoidia bacterium]|nr:hypothetical protein [Dehalococcoidia bacterium]
MTSERIHIKWYSRFLPDGRYYLDDGVTPDPEEAEEAPVITLVVDDSLDARLREMGF